MKKEEKETKKKKRKLKWQFKFILLIIVFLIYAFFIGTKGIFIKEYMIETNKIDKSMHGYKIAQFSDLHYGSSVNKSDLKKIVNKINETKPDIVIFTGDLISKKYKFTKEDENFLVKELEKINAEYGKYFITGEEDFDDAVMVLEKSDFTNLTKNVELVSNTYKSTILLADKNNARKYLENNEIDAFKIFVCHNPNNISKVLNLNFDMAISGHTHGSQIGIQKVRDFLLDTKYKKDYQVDNNTKIFINSGLGTSKIKMRVLSHPTINLYRLKKVS